MQNKIVNDLMKNFRAYLSSGSHLLQANASKLQEMFYMENVFLD